MMGNLNQSLIRLSKAFVGQEELDQIKTVLFETVNFGLGTHVQEFEEKLKTFLKTKLEVIAVNTGTSALHAALVSLNTPKESEVLVPSITFVASYSAISAAGLKPISCEVLNPSCHIDPLDAEGRITDRTVAIMPVAYAGVDFDRDAIYSIAKKHNLRVIEDDAHAFGSRTLSGDMVGSVGDIICFSFDGIKNITCGEGGAILTTDQKLAKKIRILRSLGIEKDVDLRYKGQRAWEYDVATQGFRYHMSNINAAMGVAQLARFPEVINRKRTLWEYYEKGLKKHSLTGALRPTQQFNERSCIHIFSCVLADDISRNNLREHLKTANIESGFHYVPNHLHSMYKSNYALPIAEKLGAQLISLPFHPGITEADIDRILTHIADFIREKK
jgi:dTDP-4-amino-4,6-dideoxygalactose transaminase